MNPEPERELPPEIFDALQEGMLEVITPADWNALYSMIDAGLPSKDVILRFTKRELRNEDSSYPLNKLLTELSWNIGSLGFEDVRKSFFDEHRHEFRTQLGENDYEAMRTMKAILDRFGQFSPTHFLEINSWRSETIPYAVFDNNAQFEVDTLVSIFLQAYAEESLPIEVDPYMSESALRLARAFFGLRSIKDELLRPAPKEPSVRDDPEYVVTHPVTLLSEEPLLVAYTNDRLILTKLSAPLEKRELILLSPPEQFKGSLSSLRTDHSTFIAATTQRVREQRITIWNLQNAGSCPATVISGDFVDCLLFRRPGEVAPLIAAVTGEGRVETFSVQGERLSSTVISEQLPRGIRHEYTLLCVHHSDGDERLFLKTDKQIASVSLRDINPQIVVSDVLSRPHEAMSAKNGEHFWSIQDCCLTVLNEQPVLAALRKDNVLFFLDVDTLEQAAAPLQVCEYENYGMSLTPNCLGFDLVLGKLSCTPRLPVLQGISVSDRRVTAIDVPDGDIISVVPLSGQTQPGIFAGGSHAPPTVVTRDSRGQLRAETLVPVKNVRYLTVV
jgi:hypothetical protein